MKRPIGFAAALGAAAALCACSDVKPDTKPRVCYQVTFPTGKPMKYFVVAENVPTLEGCAAKLEGIRVQFLALGGTVHKLTGAYEDEFLFLEPGSVYASRTLTGPRYIFMARNYDGRLVRPGAGDTIPKDPSAGR